MGMLCVLYVLGNGTLHALLLALSLSIMYMYMNYVYMYMNYVYIAECVYFLCLAFLIIKHYILSASHTKDGMGRVRKNVIS